MVELKEIRAVETEPQPAGVPWKEAPVGPACVVAGGGTEDVGDIVVILNAHAETGGATTRIFASRYWPWPQNMASNIRVEPLGPCEVTFVFE